MASSKYEPGTYSEGFNTLSSSGLARSFGLIISYRSLSSIVGFASMVSERCCIG